MASWSAASPPACCRWPSDISCSNLVSMRAFRVGVAGPVGSGKTALVDCLSRELSPRISVGVVTNDIYTKEDAEFLIRQGTLPEERIRGVETGGGARRPHTPCSSPEIATPV